MNRAMFTGVSGLRVHLEKMDIVSNNISNVNTVGYKSQRATFSSVFAETISKEAQSTFGASSVSRNPMQVGLGVMLSGVDKNMEQGNLERTDRTLDAALDGPGFFIIGNQTANAVTRDGSFDIDENGSLNLKGKSVWGWPATANAETGAMEIRQGAIEPLRITDEMRTRVVDGKTYNLESIGFERDGSLVGRFDDGTNMLFGQLAIADIKNPEGLQKMGDNLYAPTPNTIGYSEQDGTWAVMVGIVMGGNLEMSNTNMGEEFTHMIIAQRGLQTNSKVISTADEMIKTAIQMKK